MIFVCLLFWKRSVFPLFPLFKHVLLLLWIFCKQMNYVLMDANIQIYDSMNFEHMVAVETAKFWLFQLMNTFLSQMWLLGSPRIFYKNFFSTRDGELFALFWKSLMFSWLHIFPVLGWLIIGCNTVFRRGLFVSPCWHAAQNTGGYQTKRRWVHHAILLPLPVLFYSAFFFH